MTRSWCCRYDAKSGHHRSMRRVARPIPTEHQEQAAVVQWWQSYARTRGLDVRLLIAIPNAQKHIRSARNPAAAYQHAINEGMQPGTPDLMLAMPKTVKGSRLPKLRKETPPVPIHYIDIAFHGLFLEMKRTKGSKTAPEQLEMADLLRRQGYNVVICKGADEAIRAIRGYVES